MQNLNLNTMFQTTLKPPPMASDRVNYYLEAIKLYYYNCILYNQFDKLYEERNALLLRVQKQQQASNVNDSSPQQQQLRFSKKPKMRRCANQIDRGFNCNFPGCQRSYGTEGSLIQHMRLKHEDFMKNHQMKIKLPILQPKELIQMQMQKQEQEEMLLQNENDD